MSRRVARIRAKLLADSSALPAGRQRQIVEDGISDILAAVKQRDWQLDDWTAIQLATAMRIFREGRFDDARIVAALAVCEPDERFGELPPGKPQALVDLQVELAKIRVVAIR